MLRRTSIMVLAYHVIMGTYGFWLPNDPRGSWSEFVASWQLLQFGRATKMGDRVSQAAEEHDVALRMRAKTGLKYPPVAFTGIQARAFARGFASVCEKSNYSIYACAILPEHIHLVIGRHDYVVEQIVRRLKQAASLQLAREGIHPFANVRARRGALKSPFADGLWKCFIDSDEYLEKAIEYVHENPLKEGKRRQAWWFVRKPYA